MPFWLSTTVFLSSDKVKWLTGVACGGVSYMQARRHRPQMTLYVGLSDCGQELTGKQQHVTTWVA